ncbi:M20 family metallopeptidase [Rhodococcus sp. NPDC059968]|uniref:M20 metallopeptidase family protein n=1 Tax=Rhodococcus sp. NPDC059968 TaxID=3347017 RepID=UPI00366E283A
MSLTNHQDHGTGKGQSRIDSELYEDMRGWRRHLHANPELGYQEHQTSAYIRSLLDGWGIPYETPLDTATVAHLRGSMNGPVLALRADIDALPIQEESSVPYASTRPGVMHACGHDGHTAILLGLAKLMSERRRSLRGEIRLVFQPAEELVDGGAHKLLRAGVLDGVTAIVGLHLSSNLATGVIALDQGAVMASDDRFDIAIAGAGGHAGSPHTSSDALYVAATLVPQLHSLVARLVDPLEPAILSVGTLSAGDAYNAIPGHAQLSGTIRALSPAVRDQLQAELMELAAAHAAANGTQATVAYHRGSPPLINDADLVTLVRPAAERAVGLEGVRSRKPVMAAEDFAFYSEVLPAAFAFIGAGDQGSFPHHHPRFDLREEALDTGLRFLEGVVELWAAPEAPVPDLKSAHPKSTV